MLGKLKLLFILLVLPLLTPIPVLAYSGTPTYSSPNYSATQVFFGSGGGSETDPTNGDTAQVAVGETGVGNFSSSNYQIHAGFNTTATPFLQAVVTSTNLDLGVLSTSSTATGTATFYVRAWNADGYIVQTDSPPPTNVEGGNTLFTNSTPTSAYSPGTEQFGMNLVADTSPSSLTTDTPVSANPVQTTTYCCTIGYGAAYGNYTTTNEYAYNNGDIIANSTKSTSSTLYTISYIFNISKNTIAGQYNFNQNLVVTATY